MQQSQPRLGDILDDYCPRERRVTNHAVVAMVGPDVKQTRCTTCDAEHPYRRAAVPRPRKQIAPPALSSPATPPAPKRVVADASTLAGSPPAAEAGTNFDESRTDREEIFREEDVIDEAAADGSDRTETHEELDDGPVHRRLIRATLPRIEGQGPPARQSPDFTIRQPASRANRFRTRPQHGGQAFQGNRNGNTSGGANRGNSFRQPAGRPHHPAPRSSKRHGAGRKRSK